MLNHNIPHFKALVKSKHFTKSDDDTEFINVYVFGLQSVSGKILTFHVMTDAGMLRSRVPISEIYLKKPTNDIPIHFKQLWDCFSENVTVTQFDWLSGNKAEVVLRDGSKVWAQYMFTVDWYNNPYSNEASDYKCGHVLCADDGYLVCMPNNRLLWKDSNWITKKLPSDLSIYKVDRTLPSVENISDKWISDDTDSFYYNMIETDS